MRMSQSLKPQTSSTATNDSPAVSRSRVSCWKKAWALSGCVETCRACTTSPPSSRSEMVICRACWSMPRYNLSGTPLGGRVEGQLPHLTNPRENRFFSTRPLFHRYQSRLAEVCFVQRWGGPKREHDTRAEETCA